jgi:hypothetical protein
LTLLVCRRKPFFYFMPGYPGASRAFAIRKLLIAAACYTRIRVSQADCGQPSPTFDTPTSVTLVQRARLSVVSSGQPAPTFDTPTSVTPTPKCLRQPRGHPGEAVRDPPTAPAPPSATRGRADGRAGAAQPAGFGPWTHSPRPVWACATRGRRLRAVRALAGCSAAGSGSLPGRRKRRNPFFYLRLRPLVAAVCWIVLCAAVRAAV